MCDTRFNYLSQRRNKKGRFQPAKPKELRRGSLYSVTPLDNPVKIPVVARYRAAGFGEFLLFSTHNQPFVARKQDVTFADDTAVKSYLAASKK